MEKKLAELNNTLAKTTYLGGHQPSQADAEEFNKALGNHVHFKRWLLHIASFTEAERRKWIKAAPAAAKVAPAAAAGDDDDMDLFGDDDEDDGAAEKLKEQRQKEADAKKSGKKAVIAKSSVVLDVKVWDDETDLKEVEGLVRNIQMDGLLWGASKQVPLAFGINKLQIMCVVEDEKVSIDDLTDKIGELELVQSTDIASFQKI